MGLIIFQAQMVPSMEGNSKNRREEGRRRISVFLEPQLTPLRKSLVLIRKEKIQSLVEQRIPLLRMAMVSGVRNKGKLVLARTVRVEASRKERQGIGELIARQSILAGSKRERRRTLTTTEERDRTALVLPPLARVPLLLVCLSLYFTFFDAREITWFIQDMCLSRSL
tara:strand:- start:245 stop:748 length:504 start_codon:yes stop_codon:yes gene_type:complete